MKLYGYWRSSSAWRVRIALLAQGPALREPAGAPGARRRRAARRRLPRASTPWPRCRPWSSQEGGATRRISQSLAILGYLERIAPQPALIPADPFSAARAWQLAEMVNAGIQPLQNSAVLLRVKNELRGDEQAWARHFIARGLAALEAVAAETAGRLPGGRRGQRRRCLSDSAAVQRPPLRRRRGCLSNLAPGGAELPGPARLRREPPGPTARRPARVPRALAELSNRWRLPPMCGGCRPRRPPRPTTTPVPRKRPRRSRAG